MRAAAIVHEPPHRVNVMRRARRRRRRRRRHRKQTARREHLARQLQRKLGRLAYPRVAVPGQRIEHVRPNDRYEAIRRGHPHAGLVPAEPDVMLSLSKRADEHSRSSRHSCSRQDAHVT